MRNVVDDFKIDLRTYGRQLDAKVKVNDIDFDSDNLNYIKPAFNTSLFKTIMHQVEIDSKVLMSTDTKINIKLGIKLNEKNYKYIDLGTYYVKTCERQEDTNSYRVIAYTRMKDAMIDYDLEITEKIPVRDYLIRMCQRLGWNTDNIPATFINSTKLIDPTLHVGINYTFRDVLDEIATISCSFLLFKDDGFYLMYLTETDANIDESYLDEDNITIGEKYFINSLVFSRAEESDNIYRKDDYSISLNGLHEYRISDCQLLSTNDRVDYIDEMFNYLKTLEFYIFDIQSKGILFLEACDIFNLVLNEVKYKTILLNDEINIEDGLKENLYLDEPEETETEYKYADSTDKKINQTYILVDKQNQKITQLVNQTTEHEEKITQHEQTIDGMKDTIVSRDEITEQINELKQTIEGLNQTLTQGGGDNIFYYAKEFWTGNTEEDVANLEEYTDTDIQQNSVSGMGYTINKGWSKQKVQVKNDNYVISLKYKKLVDLATGYILLNGTRYDLTETNWAELVIKEKIDTNVVDLEIYSDTDGAFKIFDLMGNVGTEKQIWMQNPNETRTDTVSIGKGIQVNSSAMNTYTRIDADGNRTFNSATGEVVMEATDKGVSAKEVKADAGQIGGIFIQEIDGQTWISSLL